MTCILRYFLASFYDYFMYYPNETLITCILDLNGKLCPEQDTVPSRMGRVLARLLK